MKLTPAQQQSLHRDAVPQMLQEALSYARDGWAVFPLAPGSKEPFRGSRGASEATTDEDQIRKWWTSHPSAGIGGVAGEDRIIFDLDFESGAELLQSFPDTRVHYSGKTDRKTDMRHRHLIYRRLPGTLAATIKPGAKVLGSGMDVRAGKGSYVVLPPTVHENGVPYERVGGEEHLLTDEDIQAIWDEAGYPLSAKGRAAKKGLSVVSGGKSLRNATMPTMLIDLLRDPPAEGGRNDWLSRVAGHYAKQYRDKEDLYRLHCEEANQKLAQPLSDAEFEKTINSIWGTEVIQHVEREASDKTGWLVGNGRVLFCQIMRREGEENVPDLAPWGDFDIRAEGVAVDDAHKRVYWVKLIWDGHEIRTTVDSGVLGDDRRLRVWLAQYGASFDTPFNAVPKTLPGVRMMRYLSAQNPPEVAIVDTLGWQSTKIGDGFVTHDGLITAEGWTSKEEAGVVANPKLVERDLAPYHYGWHGSRAEAMEVLAQTLQFQEKPTTAIFGAWWAACFLKPQIAKSTSLFPLFGVEATSESGKTTGFFNIMVQLNGNHQGHVAPTKPVLRDYTSANRNGIVWVDDLDSLSAYEELLRASTTNGTVAKMDADNTGVKSTLIVAPMLISGENLGFNTQKALSDRSVVIGVNSPKDRKGPDGRPQWDHITELQNKYGKLPGGITDLAGWYVVDALKWEKQVLAAITKHKGQGRNGSKHGVILAGACLLDSMLAGEWTEGGENFREVKRWTDAQELTSLDRDNTLTMTVLPWALRQWGQPEEVSPSEALRFSGIDTPAIVRKSKETMRELPEVWYSPTLLADAWKRDNNGRVSDRTESQQALTQQAAALGGTRKAIKVVGTKRAVKMRLLPEDYTQAVLDRI